MTETIRHILDEPAAYQPVAHNANHFAYPNILKSREAMSEYQRKCLDMEVDSFGVSPQSDMSAFYALHLEYAKSFGAETSKVYEDILPNFRRTMMDYFADMGLEPEEQRRIVNRVGRVRNILVSDFLLENTTAHFDDDSNDIYVNTLFSYMDKEQARDMLTDYILPHEMLHTLAVRGMYVYKDEDSYGLGNLNRSGLHLEVPSHHDPEQLVSHGNWLLEAGLEEVRSANFTPDDPVVGHATSVALFRSLVDLNPSLKEKVIRGIFLPDSPGPVYGEIEAILGPLGIEKAQQALNGERAMTVSQEAERLVGSLDLHPDVKEPLTVALKTHLGKVDILPVYRHIDDAYGTAIGKK